MCTLMRSRLATLISLAGTMVAFAVPALAGGGQLVNASGTLTLAGSNTYALVPPTLPVGTPTPGVRGTAPLPATSPVGVIRTGSAGILASAGGSSTTINNGPDQKWGDPLSTDLLDNSNVKVHLRYYGDAAGTGNQEGVGLNFTLSTN